MNFKLQLIGVDDLSIEKAVNMYPVLSQFEMQEVQVKWFKTVTITIPDLQGLVNLQNTIGNPIAIDNLNSNTIQIFPGSINY